MEGERRVVVRIALAHPVLDGFAQLVPERTRAPVSHRRLRRSFPFEERPRGKFAARPIPTINSGAADTGAEEAPLQ
jgi:hypothetical protein